MAEHQVSIRLGVDGAAKVVAQLNSVGAGGSKALQRITEATKPASRALQSLNAVGADLRMRFAMMAERAGTLGSALMALGPIGAGAAVGIAAVAAGLSAMVRASATALDRLDELDDITQQLGLDAEKFQALRFGFTLTGVKPEALVASLMRLNDQIGEVLIKGKEVSKETALAFGKLGITFAEVRAHGDDLAWVVSNVADGMKNLKTVAERTNVARALFGREGARLLPLLTQGAAGLREMTKAAEEAGAVRPAGLVKAGSELNDQIAATNEALAAQTDLLLSSVGKWNLTLRQWQLRSVEYLVAGDKEISQLWAKMSATAEAVWASFNRGWAALTMQFKAEWAEFTADFQADWHRATDVIGEVWDQLMGRLSGAWDSLLARLKANLPDWAKSLLGMGDNPPAAATKPGATIPKQWPGSVGQDQVAGGIGADWLRSTGAPSLAPPLPAARPAMVEPFDYKFAGSFDVNVRGQGADVRRVRTTDPRIRLNVNQGLAMVGH